MDCDGFKSSRTLELINYEEYTVTFKYWMKTFFLNVKIRNALGNKLTKNDLKTL